MASVYANSRTMSKIPTRINDTSGTPERGQGNSVYRAGYSQGYQTQTMKLSPLQKLQMEYQEKLQLEKEKKMTSLYEKWSEDALRRVENHSGQRNHRLLQDENSHKSRQIAPKQGLAPAGYSTSQKRLAISAQQRMKQSKPQKLPPINNVAKANSFHSQGIKHEKTSRATPPRKIRNGHPISMHNVTEEPPPSSEDPFMQDDEGHSSPPPNIQHLRLLRERRQQQKKLMRLEKELRIKENTDEESSKTRRKITDFEKWQQEQDAERMARLQKHYLAQESSNNQSGRPTFQENLSHPTRNGPSSFSNENSSHMPRTEKQKHKAANKTFVSNNGNIGTKRSVSPLSRRQVNNPGKRQEALRQNIEYERRIAELEKEMKQKQMDLKAIQEREKRVRLDSIGNITSGSDNDSDHEIGFATSQSHTPILKPVKVPSKRYGQSNHSIFTTEDDDSNNSEIGFQMKPVLVRRDGSRGSNRSSSTPQKDKTYVVQKPAKMKRNPRTRTFMSPNLKIHEEDEYQNHPPSPPLHPQYETVREKVGYSLDNIESAEDVVLNLVPCKICKRKFTKDRLAKHMKVCSKSQGKTRKVFDMTKARTQGTDAAKYVGRMKYAQPQQEKKSNWRQKHDDFINNIRNAKLIQQHVAQGGKISDLPPPPPSENPDYVKCQYCERKFNPAVAERHIPRCKDIKSRPKPPRRK